MAAGKLSVVFHRNSCIASTEINFCCGTERHSEVNQFSLRRQHVPSVPAHHRQRKCAKMAASQRPAVAHSISYAPVPPHRVFKPFSSIL